MTSAKTSGPTCRQTTVRLSEYIDGQLNAEDRSEVDQHLRDCASCRNHLGQLRLAIRAAKSLKADDEDSGEIPWRK